MSRRQHYHLAYGVNDVPPMPHYFEEVLPHARVLASLGFRGDDYYIFHSKNKQGQAFYEDTEAKLSASFYYSYFSNMAQREQYFKDVDKLFVRVAEHLEKMNESHLEGANLKEVAALFFETYELNSKVFSYFIVSQPHRTALFEAELRAELCKRVATQRIDSYLAELAVSEKFTRMGQEELEWLELLLKNYESLPAKGVDVHRIKYDSPALYADIQRHFAIYKILSIGDGSWSYNIDHFVKRLSEDYKTREELEHELDQLRARSGLVKSSREKLAKELYLPAESIAVANFLAEMGFYRFNMRVDGFMPLVMAGIQLSRLLAEHLGISKDTLDYLTPEELHHLLDGSLKYGRVDAARRSQSNEEYLIHLENGNIKTYYGDEASSMFSELIPPVDRSEVVEVTGSAAVRGKVRGKVCLYHWGDDIVAKLKDMSEHKILVAGHTRPAMMPLIREAVGIVTDEGGVTSHAAIVSRELGLPSVINTRIATEVFNDGDLVELDADSGVVRKLA